MQSTATEPDRRHYVYPSTNMARTSSTLPVHTSGRSKFNAILWISFGLTALFVFITSEVFLVADYPIYHAYRLQVIADRHLLIPHTLCGVIAGPMQFWSRLRGDHLRFHRVLGRVYVICVFIGASTGIGLAAGRPGLPGTSMQAGAWIACTTAAFITARNRQIVQHRRWMVRSYAVTFTFVSSRVLNLWPLYWSHLGDALAGVGVGAFTLASLLVVELGFSWRELTTRSCRSDAVRTNILTAAAQLHPAGDDCRCSLDPGRTPTPEDSAKTLKPVIAARN